MKLQFLLVAFCCLFIVSCGNKTTKKDKLGIDSILSEETIGSDIEISAESMNAIIESIPSPLEVAMVIRLSGTDFDQDLLNSSNNAKVYTTDQEKALNIGVYSGDLGYINIYEKPHLTVTYLSTIKDLADDINIGQFFDFATIKRMASQNDKMDSLIYLSTINFNKMDAFLRSQKRSNLSILMVTGTWAEGLYIATQVIKQNHSQELIEWVGYQKIIVDQLLLGLSAYKENAYFESIVNDLNELKEVYNGISITYDYHEPESVEIDGRLVIVDKSTSTVNITPEQVNQIGEVVGRMRKDLAKNQ